MYFHIRIKEISTTTEEITAENARFFRLKEAIIKPVATEAIIITTERIVAKSLAIRGSTPLNSQYDMV